MAKKRTAAQKAADKKRAWKMRRRKKYDKKGQKTPKAHTRAKIWVKGHKKKDGTKTKGHFRKNPHHKKRKKC